MNILTLLLLNADLILGFLVVVGIADHYGLIKDYEFDKGIKYLRSLND